MLTAVGSAQRAVHCLGVGVGARLLVSYCLVRVRRIVITKEARPCRFIILEADAEVTPWSRICVSQADCILLVGAHNSGPKVRWSPWLHNAARYPFLDTQCDDEVDAQRGSVRSALHGRYGPCHLLKARHPHLGTQRAVVA